METVTFISHKYTLLLFSCLIVSNFLQPHGLQHARPPCLSPSLKDCPSWCHCISYAIQPSHSLMLSSPFALNLSQHQGFFQWFVWWHHDQNTGASALASVLPMSIQGWSPLRLTWFDLLAVQGNFSSHLQQHSLKVSILWRSAFFTVQLSQLYVTSGKTTALTIQIFVGWVRSLLFNILSRFFIPFLPRSNWNQ